MSLAGRVYWYTTKLQGELFPELEEELGPLSPLMLEFIRLIEISEIDKFVKCWRGFPGRPQHERASIARAFLAKTVFQIPTNLLLIDRLKSDKSLRRICNYAYASKVPSESTFSRAFSEFAEYGLPTLVHEALIKATIGSSDHLVGHISRDSTAIEAREKPVITEKRVKKKKAKRGRPRKGEERAPKEPTRIQLQAAGMSLDDMLVVLPKHCDIGSKRNARGYMESWCGYKLHIDTADGGIPVSFILTSASLHDSQVAIPLGMMTAERVTNLYDLMDSAYDAPEIYNHSLSLGHIAIIDKNPRGNVKLKEKLEGEEKARRAAGYKPAEAIRYNERSTAERCNSSLKDHCGGRIIYFRGAKKVMCHLMFGILAIAVNQIFRLIT